MNGDFPKWINNLATIATIVGFLITVYVSWSVRSIRHSYRQRARLPELSQDLSSAGSKLSRSLASSSFDRHDAHIQLNVAATLIEAIAKISVYPDKRAHRRSAKRIRKIVRGLERNGDGAEDQAWTAYGEVQQVIVSVEQAIKSSKWE